VDFVDNIKIQINWMRPKCILSLVTTYQLHRLRKINMTIFGAGVAQSLQSLGYGLDDRDSILGRAWEFLSSPSRPERL